MLVYNGYFDLDNIELVKRVAAQSSDSISHKEQQVKPSENKAFDVHKALGLAPPATQTRLVCNRACALVVLVALNALTYFAITTFFKF